MELLLHNFYIRISKMFRISRTFTDLLYYTNFGITVTLLYVSILLIKQNNVFV
jgi:hypothetical protein